MELEWRVAMDVVNKKHDCLLNIEFQYFKVLKKNKWFRFIGKHIKSADFPPTFFSMLIIHV